MRRQMFDIPWTVLLIWSVFSPVTLHAHYNSSIMVQVGFVNPMGQPKYQPFHTPLSLPTLRGITNYRCYTPTHTPQKRPYLEAQMPTQTPKRPKTNPHSHELSRNVHMSFSLLSYDVSQESSRNCSEKHVQMNFFIWVDFFEWLSTSDYLFSSAIAFWGGGDLGGVMLQGASHVVVAPVAL